MQTRWLISSRHRLLADPSGDAALLRRYSEDRDSAAFECLLWRHGGMVLGTCQRILRDRHLAEDAYQATFLILARKAGTVRGVLPAWLHRVARRVCMRLKKRWPEPLGDDVAEVRGEREREPWELSAILDGEIAKLTEKHRRVVALCYLQNLTAEAAACELGIPRGTVLSRLDAARRKLQAALTRRGIAPLAILTIPLIHAQPSAALVQATQEASLAFSSCAAPTPITELAHEVLQMTTRKWIAGSAAGLIALAFASTGVGLFTVNGAGPSQAVAQVSAEPPKPTVPKPVDEPEAAAKRQRQQLDALNITEAEVKSRIEMIGKQAAKEKDARGAGLSPSALQQAIDKIDLQILEREEELIADKAMLDAQQKRLKPAKDYPLESVEYKNVFGNGERFSVGGFGINGMAHFMTVATFPEIGTYQDELAKLNTEGMRYRRDNGADSAKYTEYLQKRTKLIDTFKADVFPAIQKKAMALAQADYHEQLLRAINQAKHVVEDSENFPKTVAKRRAELVERLNRATSTSEEQKLLDDELQVLREFRKAVLKQKLTLKLEIDGVKLPEEPKK